jgi:hypothetical protein
VLAAVCSGLIVYVSYFLSDHCNTVLYRVCSEWRCENCMTKPRPVSMRVVAGTQCYIGIASGLATSVQQPGHCCIAAAHLPFLLLSADSRVTAMV